MEVVSQGNAKLSAKSPTSEAQTPSFSSPVLPFTSSSKFRVGSDDNISEQLHLSSASPKEDIGNKSDDDVEMHIDENQKAIDSDIDEEDHVSEEKHSPESLGNGFQVEPSTEEDQTEVEEMDSLSKSVPEVESIKDPMSPEIQVVSSGQVRQLCVTLACTTSFIIHTLTLMDC